MKVIMGKYMIDVNESDIRKSRKTSWVSQRVKAFEWTGIDRDVLTEKFSEVFDSIKESDTKESE